MNVTLLDTKTGRTVHADDTPRAFEWAENNWSCDCNRASYFGVELPRPHDRCAGAHRFLVREFHDPEDSGYTLADMNADYPEELLRKHFLIP